MGGTQGGPGAAAEPEGEQAPPARGLGPPRRAQDVLPQLRAALLDAQPEVVVVPRTVRCCTLCASHHTTHPWQGVATTTVSSDTPADGKEKTHEATLRQDTHEEPRTNFSCR